MLVVQSSSFAIWFPPPHCPLQLTAHEPASLKNQGYISNESSWGLLFLRRESVEVVAHQVNCLCVNY